MIPSPETLARQMAETLETYPHTRRLDAFDPPGYPLQRALLLEGPAVDGRPTRCLCLPGHPDGASARPGPWCWFTAAGAWPSRNGSMNGTAGAMRPSPSAIQAIAAGRRRSPARDRRRLDAGAAARLLLAARPGQRQHGAHDRAAGTAMDVPRRVADDPGAQSPAGGSADGRRADRPCRHLLGRGRGLPGAGIRPPLRLRRAGLRQRLPERSLTWMGPIFSQPDTRRSGVGGGSAGRGDHPRAVAGLVLRHRLLRPGGGRLLRSFRPGAKEP